MNLYCLYGFIFFFLNLDISAQNQEDKIYHAIDVFVAHPSAKALQNLTQTEADFWKDPQAKTGEEFLAIVVLNCNMGYYENQFGQTEKAVSSYEKAWQLYQKKKLSNYDIIEYCLKPLGNLYTILGDYENAENIIKHYFFIASAKNYPDASRQKFAAILNLSNVYQSSGKISAAIDLLKNTMKTEKLTNVQKGVLLNNLGTSYLLSTQGFLIRPETYDNAENAFKLAVNYLKNEKHETENLSNSYLNLSTLNRQRHQFDAANFYLEKATQLSTSTANLLPRKISKLYYEKALLLFEERKYVESAEKISEILEILLPNYSSKKELLEQNELYAETLLIDALDLKAEIYWKQNQQKKALKTYQLSFTVEDLLMHTLVYENSKIITQVRARNRTEKCLSIYYRLFEDEHKIDYLQDAFKLAEQTKSGILKSYRSNLKTASAEEKMLVKQLQTVHNNILKEQQKGESANILDINKAIKKQNELMLSLKSIPSKTTEYNAESCDLKELFTKLEKDKAIMSYYFMGSEYLYCFILQNDRISLQRMYMAHYSQIEIAKFIEYFSTANAITDDISGYNYYGNRVYKTLKIPQNAVYPNLIIVPDGLLNFLPFEALITAESKTANFAKMHYLVHDFKIAYNNSATMYLKSKPISRSEKTVLGVFPVFEKTTLELNYSKKELESIRSNFKGKYLENSAAGFSNFKNNAANFSILHLSTHASSGDVETPASIKFYDQEVLYTELYNLNINPDLVVLSACETGIGKLFKAEGAMSVARGFQFAGAQNLLFSLWKVNDYTTSVFMSDFYKNVKSDVPYFEANRNAKLDYLADKSIPNAKKSPYYWSSFVYYGAISEEEKSGNIIFYAISFLIVIGLFLVFNHYQKWKIFTRFSKKRNTRK